MTHVVGLSGGIGSGKSTVARKLTDEVGGWLVVSTDNFMVNEAGEYEHSMARLGECHEKCFLAFLDAVQDGVRFVVVDNTNSEPYEIAPYMLAAKAFGYEAKVVEVVCDPDVAFARNRHETPRWKFDKLVESMSKELPDHWTVEKVG